MAMTEEERRAAAFREQCATRLRWRAGLAVTLRGDPAAAARARAVFAPLLPDPVDAWDCPDPAEPGRPPWAGSVPDGVEVPEYLKR